MPSTTAARAARALARPALLPFLACACAAAFAACSDDPPTTTPETDSGVDSALVDSATDTAKDTGPADSTTDSATDSKSDVTDVGDAAEVCTLPFSTKLSEMGLYTNITTKAIAAANVEFKPTYELWTDGALKRRWINMPAGKKIDTTDMDQWQFPVCTTFWKEFVRDGKIIETRLWRRIGKDEYLFGTYVWNEAQTEATWTLDGVNNALGTAHDVPNLAACLRCHEGIKARGLGFGAVQLAKATGLDLAAVNAKGWLSTPPAGGKDYGIPGNTTEAAALGWLNANCGHCHNPLNTTVWTQTDMVLRVYPLEGTAADTKLYKTTVGVPNMSYKPSGGPSLRIDPGAFGTSTIYVRDANRDGGAVQMPPLGTELVHPEGLAAVRTWIDSLPKITKSDAGTD